MMKTKKKLCQCPFRNREAPKDFSLHIFQEINFANHDKDIVYEMIRTCKQSKICSLDVLDVIEQNDLSSGLYGVRLEIQNDQLNERVYTDPKEKIITQVYFLSKKMIVFNQEKHVVNNYTV